MGKHTKLAPWFCGPLTNWFIRLPPCSSWSCWDHLVFMLSHLKEPLRSSDNTVPIETLVTSKYLPSKPNVPKRFLNVKTKHLHSKTIWKLKMEWTDKSIIDSTWEREHTIKTSFPYVWSKECNVLKRGEYVTSITVTYPTIVFIVVLYTRIRVWGSIENTKRGDYF